MGIIERIDTAMQGKWCVLVGGWVVNTTTLKRTKTSWASRFFASLAHRSSELSELSKVSQ